MKKGKQIKTLDDLVWAKADKKSVICPKYRGINYGLDSGCSAASVMRHSGDTIVRLLKLGLFIVKD